MPSTKMKKQKRMRPSGAARVPRANNGGVELLLIQSVSNLGKQGDVVTVKRGYANNYLLPQGMATIASEHHKRMVDKHRAKLAEIEKARLKDLAEFAKHVANQRVTIEANANEEGQLYGSVGAAEIVSALKEKDITVDVSQIKLEGVFKELGLYTVKVLLHTDIEADLKVWVVPTVEEDA